jgi:hypothetical protein
MLWTVGKYFIKSLEVPVIKQLTRSKFIDIATNGIQINLYDKFIEDYIENLMKFVEDVTHDYYISDYDTEWLEISKRGAPSIKAVYENGKIQFHLPKQILETKFEKADAGNAIKVVYMHSIAWDAINNNGKINQSVEPWPL